MQLKTDKVCPKCESKDYRFRARKLIAPDITKGKAAEWETKYRCGVCSHEWKVRVQT